MEEKHTYCVKCQSGKTVVGQSPVVMKNGTVALKGKCPSCSSVAYKIVGKDALKNMNQKDAQKVDRHFGLAIATFAAGLVIGSAIAMYI